MLRTQPYYRQWLHMQSFYKSGQILACFDILGQIFGYFQSILACQSFRVKKIQFPCNTKIGFWSTFRYLPKFGQNNPQGLFRHISGHTWCSWLKQLYLMENHIRTTCITSSFNRSFWFLKCFDFTEGLHMQPLPRQCLKSVTVN